MRLHRLGAGICLTLIVAACGSRSLSVTEYAAEVEELVSTMEANFAAIDAEWESQTPTREGAVDYWEMRLEIRADFLDGIEKIGPPDEVASMHRTSIDLFTRITATDVALAARVAGYETITEHRQWLETPEGQAGLAILEEVFAFCRSTQAEFDATQETGPTLDNPWIPPETREIVKVAFGCPPQEG